MERKEGRTATSFGFFNNNYVDVVNVKVKVSETEENVPHFFKSMLTAMGQVTCRW